MLTDTHLLHYERSATLVNMAMGRRLLTGVISALNIDDEIQKNIILCFSEACTNAIEHGAAKNFCLSFISNHHQWQILLRDNGAHFEPDFSLDINDIDIMQENGRGIALLAHSCDKIEYSYKKKQNHLFLCWKKNQQKKINILLVEDEIIQRNIYKSYLSSEFNVIESENGKVAFDIIQNQTIDLIIADINMPVMNGISLLELLNESDDIAVIPFVFLTGVDDQATINDVNYLGVDSYLTKPVNKQELLSCINNVLNRHKKLKKKINLQLDKKISALLQPNVPNKIQQYNLAWLAQSAQGGGGDFLFSYHLNNGNTILVLGDVMGHDHQAKFFAHTYASYIRGLLIGLDENQRLLPSTDNKLYGELLAELMTTLSDFVLRDGIASSSLLTCQLVYLYPEGIDIVSAGHPPPLILDQDTKLKKTPSEGMVLGLLNQQEYQYNRVNLNKNERLILYTDGLFDSVNELTDVEFLEQSISQAIQDTQQLSTAAAVENVMNVFNRIAGVPAKDDSLLMMIDSR